jgi:Antibiotic biosynthesis monooxygenase
MDGPPYAKRHSSDEIPSIIRHNTGAILVSEWLVETSGRQQATLEAFVAGWRSVPWPAGLLSTTLLASTDGAALLNFAQWTSADAYTAFVETHRKSLAEQLDRAVPGIQRGPAVSYLFYRGGVRPGASAPGCAVIVSVEFDGPDEHRQRQWVDSVFEAMASEPKLPPGGVSAHFLISTDATRVLNYAEWTDEDSHQKALDASGQGTIGPGPKWRKVGSFPGLKSSGFRRYRSGLSLVPPQKQEAKHA